MARYIDADKLMNFANNSKDKTIDANDIARFPSADVVEVVRCCDCKYFRNNTEFGYPWCDRRRNADLFVSGLDYCSYAERRIDGEIH